jgi:Mor family transcriptional regulator
MTTAQIIHQYRKYNESLPYYTRVLEKVGRNASLYADYSDPKRKGFILDLVVKYRISSTQIFEIIRKINRITGVIPSQGQALKRRKKSSRAK